MSRERPIIFSAAMVAAILGGRKTQTRRIVKPQPSPEAKDAGVIHSSSTDNGLWAWLDSPDLTEASFTKDASFRCPYGVPGNLLWVRETWCPAAEFLSECRGPEDIRYAASVSEAEWATSKWRPSIHMPRWASRINLLVTDVRIERLHEISEADAIAEGVEVYPRPGEPRGMLHGFPIDLYHWLWNSINGPGAWEANPWVWAITFERVVQ